MIKDKTIGKKADGQRRSVRLVGYDYSTEGAYFITVVTAGREPIFGNIASGRMHITAAGKIVQACWDQIPSHFSHTEVDVFVIMPNHIHGIIFINDDHQVVGAQHAAPLQPASLPAPLPQKSHPNVKPGSLGAIIRSFKSAVTRQVRQELNIIDIWQRNYYEHIIRNPMEYEKIHAYILDNPLNWENDEENR